jgi:stringent starvation protein B
MHEWMSDNGLTPHIVVDAAREGVQVPSQHVQNGKIILNVSYDATEAFQLNNDQLTFSARFGGVARPIAVPCEAILGIYARESGQGMIFTDEESAETPVQPGHNGEDGDDEPPGRSHLKVVK